MILELAVTAQADIVTFNLKDFATASAFGTDILTPKQALTKIGATDE